MSAPLASLQVNISYLLPKQPSFIMKGGQIIKVKQQTFLEKQFNVLVVLDLLFLVAHSATQYKGLCVCMSVCMYVPPYQINCFGPTNDSFEFLMASIGFHMVVQASTSFHNLPWASNSFQYVPLHSIECIN